MDVSDRKQKTEAAADTLVRETLCESVSESVSAEPSAVAETLAVGRDPRTGRFARTGAELHAKTDEEAHLSLGQTTRFQAGNQKNRQHGIRGFQTNGTTTLPPELRRQLELFHAGLEVDQGGAGELTTIGEGYVRRLTELEGCLLLLAADLQTRGLLTARGRVRNTYALLLQSIDRWDKLAQRLGMTRRVKTLPSLHEYLEQRADSRTADVSQGY